MITVSAVTAVEGSTPGLSFSAGGFSCEEPGTWPIGATAAVAYPTLAGSPSIGALFVSDWSCDGAAPSSTGAVSATTTTLGPPQEVGHGLTELHDPGLALDVGAERWRLYEWQGFLVAILRVPTFPQWDCTHIGNTIVVMKEGACATRLATEQTLGEEGAFLTVLLYGQTGFYDTEQNEVARIPHPEPLTVIILAPSFPARVQVIRIVDDATAPLVTGLLTVGAGEAPSLPVVGAFLDYTTDGFPVLFEISEDWVLGNGQVRSSEEILNDAGFRFGGDR